MTRVPMAAVELSARRFESGASGLASRRIGTPWRAPYAPWPRAMVIFAEMKDRGGEHRARAAVANALDEMIERADAARSDDRDRDRAR